MSSNSGTLYIGMTNSIYRRTLQHKSGQIEGFSSKYHCTRLVHYESYDDVHRAIGREKELKGWTLLRTGGVCARGSGLGSAGGEVSQDQVTLKSAGQPDTDRR